MEVHGERIDNSYAGTRYTDQIQLLADSAAARLFRARFASTRPLSGHVAALAVLAPLLPRGSSLLAIPPDQGGYDGYAPGFVPALLGYDVFPLEAGGPGKSVLEAEAVETIRHRKPTAVLLGQSFFLFPYPMRAIAEAVHAYDGLVLYDASHVFGLIAGGEFQDPLREGADLVYGSTHKSLPGPQGGIFVTDREDLFRKIDEALVWRVLDNAHWNRIAGVGQTLLELERVGRDYAQTTVSNARALAKELDGSGIPVDAKERGYTASHQIHLDAAELRRRHNIGPGALARRWERSGLIADLVGRLGAAEIARLGLGPEDMPRLSDLLVRSGIRGEAVRKEVRGWRKQYRSLRFA
jgi:glycine hydroxymethyltransferase